MSNPESNEPAPQLESQPERPAVDISWFKMILEQQPERIER